jgi:hypothetical protein
MMDPIMLQKLTRIVHDERLERAACERLSRQARVTAQAAERRPSRVHLAVLRPGGLPHRATIRHRWRTAGRRRMRRRNDTMDMEPLAQNDARRGSGRAAREAGLRASDADRAVTAELLQRHYAAGRLETHEFEERIGSCYTARTVGELHDLVVDLPQPPARELEAGRSRAASDSMERLAMVAPLVLAAVAALTGAHVVWLVWPLLFFVPRNWLWHGRRRWN